MPQKAATKAFKHQFSQLAAKGLRIAGSALLTAMKSLFTMLAPWAGIALGFLLGIIIVYSLMIYPATTARELDRDRQTGEYTGQVLGYLLDPERWTEEADAAVGQLYESYRHKDMVDLNEFQRHQAGSYSLPHALLIGIERVDMFLWDRPGAWLPDPEPLFEALKTRYSWVDSKIEYDGQYKYSYSYRYKYREYIPPRYDELGNLIREGRWVERTASGSAQNVQVPVRYHYNVELLQTADTFENVYTHQYGEYLTREVEDLGHDDHAGILLGATFPEILEQHVTETKNSIRQGFHSGAYGIEFQFDFDITQMDKTFQPLTGIEVTGEQFDRLLFVLTEKYGHVIDPLDVELIFQIATEYDPEFAYDFAANNAGYLYFKDRPNIQYVHSMSGDLYWPIPDDEPHYITSYFGPRWGRFHGGVDIGSHGRNIPILSAGDGLVTFAGLNGTMNTGYGKTVMIDHGTDAQGRRVKTLYAHLYRIDVQPGQLVRAGDRIGLMGTTGTSTGIHLHFEVRLDNRKVDPLQFFKVTVS